MRCEDLIVVLWSLNVNYPVLRSWNYVIGKPIALVFNNMVTAIPFVKKLSPHPQIIDSSTKISTAKKILLTTNSDGVFMMLSNRGGNLIKEQEKINALFSVANLGVLDGKEASVMTFFVCDRRVPDEYKSEVFEIHVDDLLPNTYENLFSFVPSAEMLPVVFEKIQEFKRDELLPFKAIIAFLYPYLKEQNNLTRYKILLTEMGELFQMAEEYQEQEDVVELVQQQFIDFINKNACDIYHLAEIEGEVEERIDEILVVKGDSLFMDDKKFKDIIKPMLEILPLHIIKERLNKEGILFGQPGDYTVKMSYLSNGKMKRIRRLKFDTDKMKMLKNYISNLY